MILDQLPSTSRSNVHMSYREKHIRSSSLRNTKSTKRIKTQTSRFFQETNDHLTQKAGTHNSEKIITSTWAEHNDLLPNPVKNEKPKEELNDKASLLNQRDKIRDYEEILQDSPPNTSTFNPLQDIDFALRESFEMGNETLEELVSQIQDLTRANSTVKKGTHKRGTSHTMMPKNDFKKLVHQSSMLLNTTDLEQMFKKSKNLQSTKRFWKMDADEVISDYADLKDSRSSLSTSLKRVEAGESRGFVTQVTGNKGKKKNTKNFRVYFFNSNLSLDVPIQISLTVGEVIKQIMDHYLSDKTVDHSLLKYPKDVEAYELRMLDDEDADYQDEDFHMPDFSLPPLEKNRVFASLGLEKGVAFVENVDFKAPEISQKTKNELNNNELMAKITKQNKRFLVLVYHQEVQQMKNPVPIDPMMKKKTEYSVMRLVMEFPTKIKDIYPKLAVKISTISNRSHQLRIYRKEATQNYEEEEDDNDEDILDDNMPLTTLKTQIPTEYFELEVVRKKFTDAPPVDPLFLKTSLFGAAEVEVEEEDDFQTGELHGAMLYNEMMASRYEEFNVIKLRGKDRAKGSQRFLGIDAFKIYNLYKELKEQNTGLANIFSHIFFTKVAPKNPERLISDVLEVKMMTGSQFQITFRNPDKKRKVIEYDALDGKIANKIVSKLQYLKNLEKKKKPLKAGYKSEFESS